MPGRKRYEGDDALALLDGIDTLVAARGKKIASVRPEEGPPGGRRVARASPGPDRQPARATVRVGKTLVVGFNEDAYRKVLGVVNHFVAREHELALRVVEQRACRPA